MSTNYYSTCTSILDLYCITWPFDKLLLSSLSLSLRFYTRCIAVNHAARVSQPNDQLQFTPTWSLGQLTTRVTLRPPSRSPFFSLSLFLCTFTWSLAALLFKCICIWTDVFDTSSISFTSDLHVISTRRKVNDITLTMQLTTTRVPVNWMHEQANYCARCFALQMPVSLLHLQWKQCKLNQPW